jgi:hypothetical protein
MPLFGWEKVSRDSSDYKTCVSITTAAGAIIGGATASVVPVAGTLAGYAGGALWGLAAGYLACPYLAPAVKRKIEKGMPLAESELRSAAEAMGTYAGVNNAPDAVKLVGMVKSIRGRKPSAQVCSNPALVAKDLLSQA